MIKLVDKISHGKAVQPAGTAAALHSVIEEGVVVFRKYILIHERCSFLHLSYVVVYISNPCVSSKILKKLYKEMYHV